MPAYKSLTRFVSLENACLNCKSYTNNIKELLKSMTNI